MELSEILYSIFLKSPINLFDEFITECHKFYEKPAHNLVEIRARENKKLRGDIFEEFCVLYLKHVLNYENVWLLKNVPNDILKKLNMCRRDMGIDIITENNGKFSAIQCKYKKHTSYKKNILTWKALSTFYALCLRTGPWEKYIVMTNCDYTLRQGKKTTKDISICLKTFQNISKDNWLKMCCQIGNTVNSDTEAETVKDVDINELRNMRLKYFSQPT